MNYFKILTPAFNCEKEIIQTAKSIACQTYKNWEWIILDDMSTDSTSESALNFFSSIGLEDKIKVKTRKEKYGEVRNTLEECALLDDNDIVVRLDAGDWLTDLGALEIINIFYERHDPAVLWTAQRWSFTDYNISGPIDPNVSLYKQPWKTSHLKTFRVKDFKGINVKNFLDDEGNFIMIACDQAIFLPMLERARIKNRPLIFIPRVMYHYNIDLDNPELFSCDRSLDQKMSAEKIRERGYIE